MNKEQIYEILLEKFTKENMCMDELMSKHTSFKIGGKADIFVKVKNIEEVRYILKITNENSIPLTIIGNGSNVLVKDHGIRGIVIRIDFKDIQIQKTKVIKIDKESEVKHNFSNEVVVTAGAGVLLGTLAQKLLKESISGFEFASGIPGTIGGAIKMNAGAYGSEFKDIILETVCMDENGKIIKINNSEHSFSYRHSVFKMKKLIILETKLLLKKVEDNSIVKKKMNEFMEQRKSKQPINMPSAGSTFKRGNDFITAKLIDECGLKGYSIGGAEVSDIHSGFIVNKGNATAEDVINLIKHVKEKIYEKYNKKIELEVEIIGE